MKRFFNKIYNQYMAIYEKVRKDQLPAFSAQAAFFLILSFFPFTMALLTLVQYLPIKVDMNKYQAIMEMLPQSVQTLVSTILDELLNKSNGAVLSVSVIVAIWSASLGIMSLMRGLNQIYMKDEQRNYFRIRGTAALYTLMVVLMIVFGAVFIVFGDAIVLLVLQKFPEVSLIALFIKSIRFVIMGVLSVLVFALMYMFIPCEKTRFLAALPGSVMSTAGFLGFSKIFSIYVDNFANYTYTYGSLAGIAIAMLWLYAVMYIFFMGAELNYSMSTPTVRLSVKLFFRTLFRK